MEKDERMTWRLANNLPDPDLVDTKFPDAKKELQKKEDLLWADYQKERHMAQQTIEIFRVKSDSEAVKVATSITKSVAQGNAISMRVIGAAALNEAVKAAIIAGQFMNRGVTFRPAFEDVEIDERTRTAIILDLTIEADA